MKTKKIDKYGIFTVWAAANVAERIVLVAGILIPLAAVAWMVLG